MGATEFHYSVQLRQGLVELQDNGFTIDAVTFVKGEWVVVYWKED